MTVSTCTHGLVQLQKFGTDTRDGLTYCRGCGLPTADSVLERQREHWTSAIPVSNEPDTELDVLRELAKQASSRNQILEGIRVGVFLILGLQVVVLLLAIFGAFRTEVVFFR